MKYIADLHIHSHFSRATAKNLDLANLYITAQTKGITVIGTGDFTHPGWMAEIEKHLEPAEPGFYKLKSEFASELDKNILPSCRNEVRFVLTVEISSIYKKNSKTRKNHNLLFVPDIEAAKNLNSRLDKIGNIKSDGRPILGLDARNLLEILLDVSDDAFLVPAHIWTPWFSTLGSKSGFDSIEECFDDLTPHIFAVETGLSSDPPMNRRVSFLDNMTLISNSDAHSPDKLGREANLFNTGFSYFDMMSAMKTGKGFEGTIEFFPEEGKYHLDGHRKCDVRLTPQETIDLNGICPVCGKALTLGVLYRVEQLADISDEKINNKKDNFKSLIPLKEILAEIFQVGPKTKTVQKHYDILINKFGSEFSILKDIEIDQLKKANVPLIDEAIKRVRDENVILNGGFDGEFGTIKIFEENERESLMGQGSFFKMPAPGKKKTKKSKVKIDIKKNRQATLFKETEKPELQNTRQLLNEEQQKAAMCFGKPLLIVAGPGTGKTMTLTQRIANLVLEKKADPKKILAVTFTQKAAEEMKQRLKKLLKNEKDLPYISTFHGLCFDILRKEINSQLIVLDEDDHKSILSDILEKNQIKKSKLAGYSNGIAKAKQLMMKFDDDFSNICPSEKFAEIYKSYQEFLDNYNCLDYEDLIFRTNILFESDEILEKWKKIFQFISVDEYQDLNHAQYLLIKKIAGKDICVIGDPNQSIYGFRGSDSKYFESFLEDYPDAQKIILKQNYRSTETILKASSQIIKSDSLIFSVIKGDTKIHFLKLKTEKAEAEAIVKTIESLIGGISHFSLDSGRVDTYTDAERSFSDIAILYRINHQANALEEAFQRSGIPYQIAGKRKLDKDFSKKLIDYLKHINGKYVSKKLEDFKVGNILNNSICDQLMEILKLPDFEKIPEEAKQEIDKIISRSKFFGTDIAAFLTNIALESETDLLNFNEEKVMLMSMHASKGLEFPVVFITGCENGLIPFQKNNEKVDVEEERRLFYVAITRAQDVLYFTRANKRLIFGKSVETDPSPFVENIEKNMMLNENAFVFKKPVKVKKSVQMKMF